MKLRILLWLAALLCGTAAGAAQPRFDEYFTESCLRIDFSLSGDALTQAAALRQLREEPLWSGPRRNLVDPFGYGGYGVNLYDRASGRLIYSRGFNTLFEEWRTTAQARSEVQAWDNSVTVPFPKAPVTVEITARDRKDMQLRPLLRLEVDPQSIFIDRSPLHRQQVRELQIEGGTAEKVDLVFLAEGYTAAEQEKFFDDARRFTESLFSTPPFSTRREDFNVRAVGLVSEETGTDLSGQGIYRNTALNSGFYTFGEERYLTTADMKSIRDAVWDTPCDAIFILVNTPVYGGGGMYNFYAIGAADNDRTPHIFVHELGHSFAGLADEYFYDDDLYIDFYDLGQEPWEPNITTLVGFDGKWRDLLPAATPVPTPTETPYTERVGVYEGGGYVSRGIYRPMDHCMMRDYAPFCPVCSRAIERMIDFLTDKAIEIQN